MKNSSKLILHVFLLSLILLSCQKKVISKGPEFDYEIGGIIGPDEWGNLHEEWAACRDGKEQSPIQMHFGNTKIVPNTGDLQINYKPSNATLINKGYDITLQWLSDAGSISIKGEDYTLLQCHWHSPSEHAVNGKRFPLEQHLVHLRKDPILGDRIAVIGILYEEGEPQAFLSQLEEHIRLISGGGQREINVGVMDPSLINMNNREFYRYMGSLTTPPCSEKVIWTVDAWVRTVSFQQVQLLRSAVDAYAESNARPLQPINGREILLYRIRRNQESLDGLVDEMK